MAWCSVKAQGQLYFNRPRGLVLDDDDDDDGDEIIFVIRNYYIDFQSVTF
jgi:hypothetical protein